MSRNSRIFAIALACLMFVGPTTDHASAQVRGPGDHPRLRAALHELREARGELRDARDAWPAGYRDRAMQAIDDAVNSIKAILKIRDVDNFRGVDRNPDYYKRFQDHPRLRSALQDLRDARQELRNAGANFGNLKERALDDIDVAIGDILTLVRYRRR